MAKTIAGLYDDRTTARKVIRDLEAIGFGKDHLQFASTEKGERTDYDIDVSNGASPDILTRYGVPDKEARFYVEGVRRGGALIVMRVHDADVEKAVDILARHNPIRFEDRGEEYASAYGTDSTLYDENQARQERERYADQSKTRLREIEENLKIGKREVVSGGVRAHQIVETDLQEETLRLREEHVDVNRTAVNRTLTPDEANKAFETKTVEMVERAEEPVVEKETVVTGEVAIGKDVDVREETVGGQVRRMRVEVEQIDDADYATAEPDFRSHYERTYKSTGRDYDDYDPAYRYGYAAGQAYGDHDYADVESGLRSDYTSRYGNGDDSMWDNTKDAVRHGWSQAKSYAS